MMELVSKRKPITNLLMGQESIKFMYNYFQTNLKTNHGFLRCEYCTFKTDELSVKKSYYLLGVPYGSDQETVRQAFVQLVKKYHPDSGSEKADPQRFQEIENAYRRLQKKFSEDRWKKNEGLGEYGLYYDEKKGAQKGVEEQNINHTAPQHRQYLTYGGWGTGTPSQRERHYQKSRAETAVKNVFQHRMDKVISETVCTEEQALALKDKAEAKKIKTRYGLERLVEDLIQESMNKGEFDNLPGQGKPLGRQFDHHNPYVDLVTHKLNQVLIDNGFVPEWIQLQKEIRESEDEIRKKLLEERSRLGRLPLNRDDQIRWSRILDNTQIHVDKLNKKIGKYNLVVPMLQKQVVTFNLLREAQRVLEEGEHSKGEQSQPNQHQTSKTKKEDDGSGLFGLFSFLMKK
ncbi:dnaJ homolog subfamily C member 28 isoform X2 [Nilaparvata lugens]|uniref:dnaJ homolog subfamily C member 28 isoform X2 n=1 Tax=Nilaparvata lugens TaxID=108931 RepID=UPI00193DAF28|nr:dnaJ homolog subfamily C member 28 isoform X2 [Nilaparvata lugens]